MGVSTLNTFNEYPGDGVQNQFVFTFQFTPNSAPAQIKVYLVTVDGDGFPVKTLQTLGSDYEFLYPDPPPVVTDPYAINFLLVAPPVGATVRIERELTLQQIYDYIDNGRFPAEMHERALDAIVMMIQQVNTIAQDALRIAGGAEIPPFEAGFLLGANEDGDGFVWVDPEHLGVTGVIGLPPDGAYGDPVLGDPTNLSEDDTAAMAFDKVVSLLALIAPAPPQALSQKTLTIVGGYTARESGTGNSHYCTDDDTPTVTPGLAVTLANSFRDANAGVLSAEMDGIEVGSHTLTPSDDTGIYGELQILADFDPYAGQAGKEGIFKGLIAALNSASISLGEHTARLVHSLTGAAQLIFFVDDPTSPSITSVSSGVSGVTGYKSGVPCLLTGNLVNVQFDVSDFCGTHYNNTRIASAQSAQTGTQVNASLGGPYNPASVFNANIDLTVQNNQYSEGVMIARRAYNSKGDVTTSDLYTTIRVDSVGTETRVVSGVGQYPSSGYGSSYDSTESLALNKELQFINGRFGYPGAVDYSSNVPAGPDYTGLTPDAHNSMRWVTFSLGSITNASFVQFTLQGAQNITGGAIVSGMEVYLRVDGATPTTGWIDANAAYPGVGNPTANGDAALDVGASTATAKRVTFGAAVKTGQVFVRIGIPSGSNKRLSGVA